MKDFKNKFLDSLIFGAIIAISISVITAIITKSAIAVIISLISFVAVCCIAFYYFLKYKKKDLIKMEETRTALNTLYQDTTEEKFVELKNRIDEAQKKLDVAKEEAQNIINNANIEADGKLKKATEKIDKISTLYKSICQYIKDFQESDFNSFEKEKIENLINDIDIDNIMNPTVEIKLHNADLKDLKRQYKQIDKSIADLLNDYEKRYTTKSNLAIYRLMVVALRSELQNVLFTMKFNKFEAAENAIDEICDKYIKIAAEGNQSIAPTIMRFITETKQLFKDAAKVEYEYYVRKERAKEEQKTLREQMRHELEERKKLEEEQKKIEAEAAKYDEEIEKISKQIDSSDENDEQLKARLEELIELKTQIDDKKELILKLQNGKAGYVYVISNLGAFGEKVFKIGMTRRSDPQERIDELGDASVPFGFDVHSFIFSDDAPSLETQIHHRLNDNRVNKVNLRKEFFNVSLDELESLVYELNPTAEFNRTMAAEQYRQSLSMSVSFDDFEEETE